MDYYIKTTVFLVTNTFLVFKPIYRYGVLETIIENSYFWRKSGFRPTTRETEGNSATIAPNEIFLKIESFQIARLTNWFEH